MSLQQNFTVCQTYPINGIAETFLDAVTVWINKPHVVNRRLCGAKILRIVTTESAENAGNLSLAYTQNELEAGTTDREKVHEETVVMEVNLKENACERFVVVHRELLPKQTHKYPSLLEAIVYDKDACSVCFYPIRYNYQSEQVERRDISNELAYRWTFSSQGMKSIQLEVSCSPDAENSSSTQSQVTVQWLRDTLTPKISRWSEETNLNTSITSLKLVGVDRYSQMYSLLKDKYGAELVQNWCEKTDPHKFVYEDIAIAAYLLLLWEDDRKRIGSERKQSFVDLGCGNGLLVYILTREGHKGLGIDLRRRNIWDTYGSDVKLEERPITPSAENLFPDYDWLIGNHSDELTPWIPVMAARSSYSCNYFVLPCCHHDFNQRFSSKAKGLSQYRTYLTYVAQVSEVCGFQVEEDTLRIPSTKRVCHIGRHRTYAAEQEAEMDKRRQEFIQSRCATKPTKARHTETQGSDDSSVDKNKETDNGTEVPQKRLRKEEDSDSQQDGRREGDFVSKDSDSQQDGRREGDFVSKGSDNSGGDMKSEKTVDVWAENFQARESVERVRNCQRVGSATKNKVVRAVFDLVLNADDASVAVTHDGSRWRKGGSVPLGVVAQKLDKATREELKSECGGVQTLLRNHNYIFQVSGGKVHLRDFSIDNPWSKHVKAKSRKVDAASHHKTTLCWFHDNHPDGCPRRAENCTFAHGTQELKPRDQSK